MQLKNIFLFLLLTMGSPHLLQAQNAEMEIRQVITALFDGMRQADSAAVASVFSPDCTMQTIATDKAGKSVVRNEEVSKFVSSIARQKPGMIDEQIVFETIKSDGPLAIVWTPYRFIYNGNFSHSGVNVFCLVNLGGNWKIQYIIDTRKRG
ncbi:MAG: nuclear transport factor 2 family protein [Bacteroidota bacterium]